MIRAATGASAVAACAAGRRTGSGTGAYQGITGSFTLTATVDEIDVGKLKEGMPARIKVGALPDAKVDGKVYKIRALSSRSNKTQERPVDTGVKAKGDKASYSLANPSARVAGGLASRRRAAGLHS